MDFSVNYLGVLVAAIAAFVIGFLWHGPLFGKVWIKLSGMTEQQLAAAKAKSMAMPMFMALVQQLVTAFVLALFISAMGVSDVVDAVLLTFWVWLGFFAATQLNGVLWENKSVNLYLFGIVYHLVALVAMALILTLWR